MVALDLAPSERERFYLRPLKGMCVCCWRRDVPPPPSPPAPLAAGKPLVRSSLSDRSSTRISFKWSKCSSRRILACKIYEENVDDRSMISRRKILLEFVRLWPNILVLFHRIQFDWPYLYLNYALMSISCAN